MPRLTMTASWHHRSHFSVVADIPMYRERSKAGSDQFLRCRLDPSSLWSARTTATPAAALVTIATLPVMSKGLESNGGRFLSFRFAARCLESWFRDESSFRSRPCPAVLGISMEFACAVSWARPVLVTSHELRSHRKRLRSRTTWQPDRPHPRDRAGRRRINNVPGERHSNNTAFVEAVAEANLRLTVERIRELSPILRNREPLGAVQPFVSAHHGCCGQLLLGDRVTKIGKMNLAIADRGESRACSLKTASLVILIEGGYVDAFR